MEITLYPRRLARQLFGITVALSLISLSIAVVGTATGHGRMMGLGHLFSVAAESNIPTWYSSSALLICAMLLGMIAAGKRARGDRFDAHWRVLALALLFMSVDEAASIHELAGVVMDRLPKDGLMQLSWVLPAGICVLLFGLMYIRFMFHLPPSTRRHLLLAAFVFGTGALGLEAVGGRWRMVHGDGGLAYIWMTTVEEFFEMAGVVILVYGLTRYISAYMEGITVSIGDVAEPAVSAAEMPASDVRQAA